MGPAQTVALCFGAAFGLGEGLTGQAYVPPTKDASMPTWLTHVLAGHVRRFLRFAASRPELHSS